VVAQPSSEVANAGAGARSVLDAPWAAGLTDELRRRVMHETILRTVERGAFVCRKGDSPDHWLGVIDGLVKVASVSEEGRSISFIGVPAGGWFGEGSILKGEHRLFDAIALRRSTVAYIPQHTFVLLLETNVTFNRFLIAQLNERLGQFVAMVEHGRMLHPEAVLATELASLTNPLLYPGNRNSIPISQEELGHLVGLSRQRVNRALNQLQDAGVVSIKYGSVTILDLERLKKWRPGRDG
jgi:CRP/FNR family cyclic AMP-dependent transcriptional regulator